MLKECEFSKQIVTMRSYHKYCLSLLHLHLFYVVQCGHIISWSLQKLFSSCQNTYFENQSKVSIMDLRSVVDQYYGHVTEVNVLSDADLLTDKWVVLN